MGIDKERQCRRLLISRLALHNLSSMFRNSSAST